MTAPRATRMHPGRRPVRAAAAAAPARGGGSFSFTGAIREVFSGVTWTPAFIAFLYYYFVVTTYWLPGADIAIVAALVLLGVQINELRIGRVLMIFAAFVGWAWVCYAASPRPDVAFEQTWVLTKLWLVMFVAFNVLRSRAQIRFFMAFAVGCFMLFPLRGAFINYFGGYTTFGRALWNFAYSNPNDLAGFAVIFAGIALALAVVVNNRLIRIMSVLSAGLMTLLILFTQSRGTILAVAVVMFFVFIARVKNVRLVLRGALLLGVAAFFAPDNVWNRLSGLANVSTESGMSGVDQEGSAEQRYQIMRVAARVAADNAVVGVGAGGYQDAHAEYAARYASEFPIALGRKDAHNTYLRTAAELGFLGLVIFLTQVFTSVVSAWRAAKKSTPSESEAIKRLVFGLLAFLLAGVFSSLAYINMLHLHFILLECVVLASSGAVARSSSGYRSRRPLVSVHQSV